MKIIKNSLIDAGLAIFYITLISAFITTQGDRLDGGILSSVTMLLILVVSVAMMGILIFGKPVLWYLDGQKKAAVSLILYTIGILFAFLVIAVVVLSFFVPENLQ